MLVFNRAESDDRPTITDIGRLRGHAIILDGANEVIQLRLGDGVTIDIGQLHRGCTAVDIRQRKQDARQYDDEHQHVQPGRVFVHLRVIEGVFRYDLRDARLLNLDLGVIRDLDDRVMLADTGDHTEDAAGRQNLIT